MTCLAALWSTISSTPSRSPRSRRRGLMARTGLVLKSGSSSLKYQLIEPDSGDALADGFVEQLGEPSSPVSDHGAALRVAFEKLSDDGIDLKACGLAAVGHRVVHGGPVFYRPTVIDDTVI